MVSQASSENSTSIGVRDEDANDAVEVLNAEFAKEIETGAMFPMHAESGLATIAIVGENMKHTPGIAGKLFGTLGRSGISVIACAQGASETKISFVVDGRFLRKSLNVLHDSFFLSEYKVLNLFICGIGTVGSMLIEQIRSQYDELMQRNGLKLNVVGIASSKAGIYNRDGIDLEHYKELLKAPEAQGVNLKEEVIGMNIFNSVFVDCTASKDIAALYQTFLEHNISVIAANKIAASSDYNTYRQLKQVAQKRGVKFLFETNVGAGLPIIRTSPDHGTAYDIVGQGIASENSLRQAIFTATDIWRNRQRWDEARSNPLPKLYQERREDERFHTAERRGQVELDSTEAKRRSDEIQRRPPRKPFENNAE
jgi:aspartokinase/homoserine dehydrogenase 1